MTEQSNDAAVPESTADAATTPAKAPAKAGSSSDSLYIWGTGRRKTSVARVRLKPGGKGQVFVRCRKKTKRNAPKPKNPEKKRADREMSDYFYRYQDRKTVLEPLRLTNTLENFDVYINVSGGGMTGQAGAARLGIARALAKFNEDLTDALRGAGYLTRDARVRERKKYGQRGARASFQFSKR